MITLVIVIGDGALARNDAGIAGPRTAVDMGVGLVVESGELLAMAVTRAGPVVPVAARPVGGSPPMPDRPAPSPSRLRIRSS